MPSHSRRTFVQVCALALGLPRLVRAAPHRQRDRRQPLPHPTPRPGITGAKVLTAAQLADARALMPLFDGVRAIPQVVDGIRCNCGCSSLPGKYSLLSCFEGDAMARECLICQGQAKVAVRLHKEGKTLDEIRTAVDAQFG